MKLQNKYTCHGLTNKKYSVDESRDLCYLFIIRPKVTFLSLSSCSYKELVKDSDEEDYTKLFTYGDHIIAKFVFIVLTTNDNVPQSLKNQMVVVNVS